MRVLLTAASLHADYGGPAFNVARLAGGLGDAGIRVGLWAPDGSASSSALVRASPYLRCFSGLHSDGWDFVSKADVIHDNGIWRPFNHKLARLAKRIDIPRVVSIRGMLEPWAMANNRLKKRIVWQIYQRGDLKSARIHHATAEMEAESIRSLGLKVPVHVIPNGVELPERPVAIPANASPGGKDRAIRYASFLGRLHPKKGLPMLVNAWSRVRPQGWKLKIAGPDENGHRANLQEIVRNKGLCDVVEFTGTVAADEKADFFAASDLLVLPTYSENFGNVVAEALAHGVPVLTTKGTPWSSLIERRCGWWVEPTQDEVESSLRQALSCSVEELRDMGCNGHEFIREKYSWEILINRYIEMYRNIIEER